MLQSLEILPLLWRINGIWGCARAERVKISNPPPTTIYFLKRRHFSLIESSKFGTTISSIIQLKEPRQGSRPSSQGYRESGSPSCYGSSALVQSYVLLLQPHSASWGLPQARRSSREGKEEPESSETLLWPKVSVDLKPWASKSPSTNEVRQK